MTAIYNGKVNSRCWEQCLWALGNIACDSLEAREYILNANILPILLKQIRGLECGEIGAKTVWLLSALFRSYETIHIDIISQFVLVLAPLVNHHNSELAIYACDILCDLWNHRFDVIPKDLRLSLCKTVLQKLDVSKAPSLVTSVFGCSANSEDATELNFAIKCGGLGFLKQILDSSENLKMYVCDITESITNGPDYIEAIFEAGLMDSVILTLAQTDTPTVVKIPAICTILNVVLHGDAKQFQQIVDKGCIAEMCQLLAHLDHEIVENTLKTLDEIFKREKGDNNSRKCAHITQFKANGGLELIKAIIENADSPNKQLAEDVLGNYTKACPDC